MNNQTFESVISKSKQQLTKWKANTLSQEGRSTLIKSNLSAKPIYTMQSFLLPKQTLKELDEVNKKFFWNKGEKHRAPINWDEICKSKANGGTGIRKAEDINIALQMKLLWKIIAEPYNIWVRIIHEKYLKNADLKLYEKRGQTSWQWGKLISLRKQFFEGIKWVVGDGKTINFWQDRWLTDIPLIESVADKDSIDKSLLVCDLINSNKDWDRPKIFQLLIGKLRRRTIRTILEYNIPTNDFQDRMYWKESNNGWFSTKSSVQLLHKNKGHKPSELKWIWDLDCAPKIRNFMWRISKSGLQTKERLQQRRIAVPMECELCGHHSEGFFHLFMECNFVKDIIHNTKKHLFDLIFPYNQNLGNEKELLMELKEKIGIRHMSALATTWWSIWYFRNQRVFNNDKSSKEKIGKFLLGEQNNWRIANEAEKKGDLVKRNQTLP